jgi:hypothetical protein
MLTTQKNINVRVYGIKPQYIYKRKLMWYLEGIFWATTAFVI